METLSPCRKTSHPEENGFHPGFFNVCGNLRKARKSYKGKCRIWATVLTGDSTQESLKLKLKKFTIITLYAWKPFHPRWKTWQELRKKGKFRIWTLYVKHKILVIKLVSCDINILTSKRNLHNSSTEVLKNLVSKF